MAQWWQTWWFEFDPQDPCGGRRELTLVGCSLTRHLPTFSTLNKTFSVSVKLVRLLLVLRSATLIPSFSFQNQISDEVELERVDTDGHSNLEPRSGISKFIVIFIEQGQSEPITTWGKKHRWFQLGRVGLSYLDCCASQISRNPLTR
jgi:hypothetical protein